MWSRDEEVSCRLHGLQGQVFLRDRHLGASQRCDFITDHCWPRMGPQARPDADEMGHGCSRPSSGCRRGFPFQAVGRIAARRRQHGKTWARIGGADPGWQDMERGPGFGGLTSRSPQKPSTQRHLFHQETRRSRIVSNRKFSRGDPWCERSGFVAIFPHKVYGMLRKFGFRRRSVLIQWRAQGVIQVSGGKKGKADKFTYPVRIGGKQVRMIKIVALDSVEGFEGV